MKFEQPKVPKPHQPSFSDGLTDAQLLRRVPAFYRHRLAYTPSAQAVLAHWGLSPETWEAFHLGVADGCLAGRLTDAVRASLVRLGVLARAGQDILDGCIVVPLYTVAGALQALVGIPLDGGSPERTVRFGPGGFINLPAVRSSDPLTLAGTVRDGQMPNHHGAAA